MSGLFVQERPLVKFFCIVQRVFVASSVWSGSATYEVLLSMTCLLLLVFISAEERPY